MKTGFSKLLYEMKLINKYVPKVLILNWEGEKIYCDENNPLIVWVSIYFVEVIYLIDFNPLFAGISSFEKGRLSEERSLNIICNSVISFFSIIILGYTFNFE